MKIATFNINWARVHKSKGHFRKVADFLGDTDFDFLVLTEALELELDGYPFVYKTRPLPLGEHYEEIDYEKHLYGWQPYRTIIYSRRPATALPEVTDSHTSVCAQFNTPEGQIIIYGTIIGTQFRKQPYADKELANCIADCKRIHAEHGPLFLAGDLNTAFGKNERRWQLNGKATESLAALAQDCGMAMATAALERNTDHIFVPTSFAERCNVASGIFIEKGMLSDHAGVVVEFTELR